MIHISRAIIFLIFYVSLCGCIDLPNCSSLSINDEAHLPLHDSARTMCGIYQPSDCQPDEKIAILLPFRNREFQLRIVVDYLTRFLITHRKHFAIFVLEPIGNQTFNRGKLFNVGFAVAQVLEKFDCFFFHDVDLLPMNRSLPYRCPAKGTVQHWSSIVDRFDNKLPYDGYVGGVSAMTAVDFVDINGYPNEFWGWGGEDDCFGYRIRGKNLTIVRAKDGATKYSMLRHGVNEKGNEVNPCRSKILNDWHNLWSIDGLNSTKYGIESVNMYNPYIHVFIDQKPPEDICEIMKKEVREKRAATNMSTGVYPEKADLNKLDKCIRPKEELPNSPEPANFTEFIDKSAGFRFASNEQSMRGSLIFLAALSFLIIIVLCRRFNSLHIRLLS